MIVAITKNKTPFSAIIRWCFKQRSSHIIFIFDKKIVLHSNLLGVRFDWLKNFLKKSEIVDQIEYNLSLEQEEEIFQMLCDKYYGQMYDFMALLYFAWRGFLYLICRAPLPARNPFDMSRSQICVEIAEGLPDYIIGKDRKDFAMVLPDMLFEHLKKVKEESKC